VTSHASAASLAAYAAGDPGLDDATGWAVEVHLEGCADCRQRLAEYAGPPLRGLLDEVQVMIDQGVRTGPPPTGRHVWRRVAHRWAAWSLIPWAAITTTAVLAAVLLDRTFPHLPSLVLLLAPMAPLAGMAVTWSHRTDPAWETIAGTSRAGLELLLRRTLVILAAVLPPLAAAGWYLGQSPARWLLPALTLTAATLLLGGRIGVARAATLLGGGWLVAVALPAIVTARLPVLMQPAGLRVWAAAAVVVTALALLRANDHQRLNSRR
jgi:hypothetical protein